MDIHQDVDCEVSVGAGGGIDSVYSGGYESCLEYLGQYAGKLKAEGYSVEKTGDDSFRAWSGAKELLVCVRDVC